MKNTINTLLFAVLFGALGLTGFAQTATTQTTLNGAISTSAVKVFTVLSATGITASTASVQRFLYVDSELMQIQAISGSVVTVIRGAERTSATAHATGAPVWFGTIGGIDSSGNSFGVFLDKDPVPAVCIQANQAFSPIIAYKSGTIWTCVNQAFTNNTGNTPTWVAAGSFPVADNFPYTIMPDAAYTATLADTFIDASKMSSARTLTLPSASGIYGKVIVILNYTTATSVTLTVATGASGQFIGTGAGRAQTLAITANGAGVDTTGTLRLISLGSHWATW